MTIDELPYVCPWCGARFETRYIVSGLSSLEEHWVESDACSANRNTNNATQTKYDRPELRVVDDQDGEP